MQVVQVAAALLGWQYAEPTLEAGVTTPVETSVAPAPAVTEQGWQFENPVAPVTGVGFGEEAVPGVQ